MSISEMTVPAVCSSHPSIPISRRMMSVVISMSIHTAHTSAEKMQRLFMPAS
jgi:hypothetical protein